MMDWIPQFINDFITAFNDYAKENQMIAGALSLWGLSVLSYFGRNVPMKIWTLIIKQITTSLTILSSNQDFYNFMKWFYKQGYSNNMRNIKAASGRWGDDDSIKSAGYGTHYFLYKYIPFRINMTKIDNTNSIMERDEITITIFGRSHNFFNTLFKEIRKIAVNEEKIQVYKFKKDYWEAAGDQMKRNLDTVFLENNIKSSVIQHINTFIEKESWYINNGLSYQTGILLYGHPGCGKTSFIKAIASKYNKPLYILSTGMLYCIDEAIMKLPDKSILLIEDIDNDPALHERQKEMIEKDDNKSNTSSLMLSLTNFSDVLNALDGILTIHGRILIATTNRIEKLDSALLRNGRFDLKVEIGYANNYVVKKFFKRYYPNFIINPNFTTKEKLRPSDIQNLILKNLENPEKVLNKIMYKKI